MGAWGVNPLESDEGLDIKEMWDFWVEGVGAKPIDYEDAMKRFFNRWDDAIKYGDTITNNEVIALTMLHFDNEKNIPENLFKATENALNRELEAEQLDKWEESEKDARRVFLLNILEKIGGKRKKPNRCQLFSSAILNYRSPEIAKSKLLKSFVKLKKSKVPIGFKKSGFPGFFRTLDRFMTYGVWEKDINLYLKAKNERCMMLATYLAVELNWSEEELSDILSKINKKQP